MNDPPIARYFYRLRDDDFVTEFCVATEGGPAAGDARQFVETLAPDGTPQRWARRDQGDLIVFKAPDGYAGGQGLLWSYDPRLQRGEAMPRAELERRALNMRVSVVVPG